MTKQQATDIAAKVDGVEVREHPKCEGGRVPYYYAVCGNKSAMDDKLDAVRDLCRRGNHAFNVQHKPAWASDCEWAVY